MSGWEGRRREERKMKRGREVGIIEFDWVEGEVYWRVGKEDIVQHTSVPCSIAQSVQHSSVQCRAV